MLTGNHAVVYGVNPCIRRTAVVGSDDYQIPCSCDEAVGYKQDGIQVMSVYCKIRIYKSTVIFYTGQVGHNI